MELVLDNVSKKYKEKVAVDNLSIKLEPGVIGLLGANGAGKTTLMRMMCGILNTSSGTISYDGKDVSEESYRDILGYLPQDFGYYPGFTGKEFLLYMASLKGMKRKAAEEKTNELLDIVSLKEVSNKKIKTYSGGMQRRLGIAQALLNDPEVLILDEPTAGLDPKERVRFRNLIAECGKHSIVVLSTHIVSDVEHIADRILMMQDGHILWDGTQKDAGDDLEELYLKQFGGEDYE